MFLYLYSLFKINCYIKYIKLIILINKYYKILFKNFEKFLIDFKK